MKWAILYFVAFLALNASGHPSSDVSSSSSSEAVEQTEAEDVTNNTATTSNETTTTERDLWSCDDTMTTPILNSFRVAGSLFSQELQSLVAAHCDLAGNHLWPADAIDAVEKDPKYDFIVVGAGSAGAVLANRLSENSNWTVLLIERGGNPTVGSELPLLFYNNMNTEIDWAYRTEPQEEACQGYTTKGCAMPRGKVLGGSSSTNAMFYVRGNKKDFDEWDEPIGTGEWNYESVLPYFMKSEDFTHYTTDHEKYHGVGGYLTVENNPNLSELENLVIKGNVELGMKNNTDINGADQMGVMKSQTTTRNGTRCSTARAYLSPIKDRPNLSVLKYAHVLELLFELDTNVVKGVLLNRNGKNISVEATKEVIVSCGSINSPQLLMLSGIGPQKELEKLNITVKADLPVGQNLQDHVFVPVFYTALDPYPIASSNITEMFTQYFETRTGVLADTSPHRVINFYNTTDSDAESPDMQNHHLIFSGGITKMMDMFEKHGFSEEMQKKMEEISNTKMIIMVCSVLLKPKSVGNITLTSNNPMDKPKIYSNFLQDPSDVETIIRAINQTSLKLGDTNAFKEADLKLEWPDIDACKSYEKQSNDHLKCMLKEINFNLYHPVGTNKMGALDDDTAVVDPQLRVKNITGLRVVDASIMPGITRGNTNAPTIMIAEKASDMISKYWKEQAE